MTVILEEVEKEGAGQVELVVKVEMVVLLLPKMVWKVSSENGLQKQLCLLNVDALKLIVEDRIERLVEEWVSVGQVELFCRDSYAVVCYSATCRSYQHLQQ